MGIYLKGLGVTVETILMMGGIVAAALFFASFYNVAMHQAGSAYSASESAFVGELEKKIDMAYFTGAEFAQYAYEPSLKSYKLAASEGRLSLEMDGRLPVYVITSKRIEDTLIEDSDAICITKDGDSIFISGGKCSFACDIEDDVCDESCERFGVSDPVCG